jgi:hypothetical protein
MPACEAQSAVNLRSSGSSRVVKVISPGGGRRRGPSASSGGDVLCTTVSYPRKPRITRDSHNTVTVQQFSFISVHEPYMAEFAPVIGRIRG